MCKLGYFLDHDQENVRDRVTQILNLKLLTRISEICWRGFVGLSSHTSFVRWLIAEATSFRFVVSTRLHHGYLRLQSNGWKKKLICRKMIYTNLTTTPDFGVTCDSRRSEPPYMSSPATISSPATKKMKRKFSDTFRGRTILKLLVIRK